MVLCVNTYQQMNSQEHLDKIRDAVVASLKSILVTNKITACGNLYNSIEGKISRQAIEVSFNAYGVAVDEGTGPREPKGGKGFYNEIYEWTKCKGITPHTGTREQMAWAIYKNIWNEGTKANPWIHQFETTLLTFSDDVLKYADTLLDPMDLMLRRAFK